jgi:hypothetical protein
VTGRWRAVAIGGSLVIASAILATFLAGGPSIWDDYLTLLRHVSNPITTPHNFTPGSVAYQLGMAESTATAIQIGASIAVIAALVYAAFRLPSDTSFLVAVIASQLLSPILWDHYAMLLLLPVAWLLARRQWWAVLIPLLTSVVVLFVGMPAVLYPIAFWAALLGVVGVGWREREPDRRIVPA